MEYLCFLGIDNFTFYHYKKNRNLNHDLLPGCMEIGFYKLFRKGEEGLFWDCIDFPDEPVENRNYHIPHYHFVGQLQPAVLRKKVISELTDAFDENDIELAVSGRPSREGISMKLEIQGEHWPTSGRPRHVTIGSVTLEHGRYSLPSGIVLHQVCLQYIMPRVEGTIYIPETCRVSVDPIAQALQSMRYTMKIKPEN